MSTKSLTAAVGHETVLPVFSAVLLQLLLYDSVSGHGRLVEPPSRASMWRYGYGTKPDFRDNEQWCGGFRVCITSIVSLFLPFNRQRLNIMMAWKIIISVPWCIALFIAIGCAQP